MSLELEPNQLKNEVPRQFTRGQTLEFIMELPQTIPRNWFGNEADPSNGIVTELSAELYKYQNAGTNGFIANLNPTWEPGTGHTKIHFLVENTDEWPLGPVEFDLVMTRTVAGTGISKKYRSLPVRFSIVDGVTHG